MENGLRCILGRWDAEPRSYHKPSASQVGAPPRKKEKRKALLTALLMSVFLPGDKARWRDGPVITAGASRGVRYQGSIADLHLLDIRAGAPGPAFIYCSPARDTGKPLNWFVCSS